MSGSDGGLSRFKLSQGNRSMRDPTQQEVINSVFQGIIKAQEDYKNAFESHICSSYAPEYLMTVNIFQSILRMIEKSCGYTYGLSLEEPVLNLAESLRGKCVGIPQNEMENGRCDLSLRDIHDNPFAVIEVKKNAWEYGKDLERLKYLMNRGLKLGVFASCWFEKVKDNSSEESKDKLKAEIQYLHEYINKDFGQSEGNLTIDRKLGPVKKLALEDEPPNQREEWMWCPVCFVIDHLNSG